MEKFKKVLMPVTALAFLAVALSSKEVANVIGGCMTVVYVFYYANKLFNK